MAIGARNRPPPSPAPSTSGQPPLLPCTTWLTSSKRFWPNSTAYSRPASSKARPCTLRWPRLNTSESAPGAGSPVGRHAQDLAAERVRVLRQRRVTGVAGAGVEQAVRAEGEAPAVVDAALRDAGEHRLQRRRVVGRQPHDPVVVVGGDVEVDEPVLRVRRADGEAEQAALAARRRLLDGRELLGLAARRDPQDARGVALGHECGAVRAGSRCPTAPRGRSRPPGARAADRAAAVAGAGGGRRRGRRTGRLDGAALSPTAAPAGRQGSTARRRRRRWRRAARRRRRCCAGRGAAGSGARGARSRRGRSLVQRSVAGRCPCAAA